MDYTRKKVNIVFWTSLLCVGSLLVAWNAHQMLFERPHILLTLMPEVIEMQEAFPEGTEFQTEFTIKNNTRTDIVMTRLMVSCGCTSLSTKEGQQIEVPLLLTPSKPLAIQTVVNTKGKSGKNVASIVVQYEHKGEFFMSVVNILFNVMPDPNDETGKV